MRYSINKAKAAAASRTKCGDTGASVIVLRIVPEVGTGATEYRTAAEVSALVDLGKIDATNDMVNAIKAYSKVYPARNSGMLARDLAHIRALINPESAEAKAAEEATAADWSLELALRRADAEKKLRDTVINGREAYVIAATARANKAFTRKEEKVEKLDKRAEAVKAAAENNTATETDKAAA